MAKKGHSRKGLFGTKVHYDSSGNKIGHSRPSWFDSSDEHYED